MGKSPGKWIKTLLFGKKSSKPHTSKGRSSKSTDGKDWGRNGGGPALAVDSLVISEPVPINTDQLETNLKLEEEATSNLPCGGDQILPKYSDERVTAVSYVTNDPERAREEQAVIKAQAVFRGYLARRAFRALKGIIRLQALIRGHLVRRQAVATLHCMWGIVKFQAFVRGRRVRHDMGFEVAKHASTSGMNLSLLKGKDSVNAFVRKLLSLSIVAKHLEIQYYVEEPNSVWSWLGRWTTSRFWKPSPRPKKIADSKPHRRRYAVETESGRPKRSVRRNFGANTELAPNGMMTAESEKPRQYIRKVSSHPADSVQESPQSELEKVKRSLRKVSSSTGESSDRVEIETKKPKHSLRKVSSSTSDALDQGIEDSAEEGQKDAISLVPDSAGSVEISSKNNLREARNYPIDILDEDATDSMKNMKKDIEMSPNTKNVEMSSMTVVADGPVDAEDHIGAELHSPQDKGKDQNILVLNGELNSEELASHESQKGSKRRSSFSAKSDFTENGLQNNTPILPSYMAATESARAKARGQNSPRLASDGMDKNAFTRRHSLPSSTNGKLTSLSPRTHRVVQTSCKGGIRSERSLLSSRDATEKPIHIEWRR